VNDFMRHVAHKLVSYDACDTSASEL